MTKVAEKKQRLLELYLSGDVPKQDFQQMNLKYDTESASFKERIQACEHQAVLHDNQQELLSGISSALKNLAGGEEWDDVFYRNILDRITVFDQNHLDIELALLPAKWKFSYAAGGERRHFDTSVPVEVSKWRFQFAGKSADRKRFVLCEEEWASPVPKGARVFEVRAVVNL